MIIVTVQVTEEKTVIRRSMSVPMVLPENDGSSPEPFMLRFAKRPEINIPPQAGNTTYMGATPDGHGGQVGDFENDDR